MAESKPLLCIYHNNCADGFGAAWAVRCWASKERKEVEYIGGIYQTGLPSAQIELADRDIIIVDFSYKRPEMLLLAEQAKSILVLDHHKTAQAELVDLPDNVNVIFDIEHSGCMLTWNHLLPGIRPPQLLYHLEDRDLWRFKLFQTREIQAAVFSYPYDFEVWDNLMLKASVADLAKEGVAIERKHWKDIHELVPALMHYGIIAGHVVPMCSLPYTLTSDAGHYMAERFAAEKFAACYWDTRDGRVFSLRSVEGGMDVSEVAKVFGGGGHQHAAGFKIPSATIQVDAAAIQRSKEI